jgi:hypothetical protein
MTNTQKKLLSAIATGALLFNSVVPVFAETTSLVISGNGADSDNTVSVEVVSSTTVTQANTADISNNVDANSSTGGNEANKNTGGTVKVDTGDASSAVSVENTANSNIAKVDGCCASSADVEISGNGADSDNEANLGLTTETKVFQNNVAEIKNRIDADSSSGGNEANKNTGGDVKVETGNATTGVLIMNKANSNIAEIGGGGAGSVSLKILGNGADTDNNIGLTLARSLSLTQDNKADISNKVEADSKTGKNEAEENTGGNVKIDTGDASTGVAIDNIANFNYADLDCGCLMDVLAKVAGNGADSDNSIKAGLVDGRLIFQTNLYSCGEQPRGCCGGGEKACNDVDADSSTGGNEIEESTAGVYGGDPSVETGNADTYVETSTTANSNVLSNGASYELPEFDFGFDFGVGVNWAAMWAWFMGMVS